MYLKLIFFKIDITGMFIMMIKKEHHLTQANYLHAVHITY